jgi:outer membrane protein assembly factor BamD (BamD/ComL family)
MKEIIRKFPGTAAAKEAAQLLAAEDQEDPKAAPHLRYAKKLYDQGMLEKARDRLKEIVKTYPVSKTTDEARKLLDKIEAKLKLSKKPDR